MELNKLTDEEKKIIEKGKTERPFSGKYDNFYENGVYVCRRCGAPLYRSENKFDAKCGWPSFDEEIPGAIKRRPDPDGERTEAVCARCGAHLGHVFEGEGLTPKNVRYCVNSVSMDFIPEKKLKNEKEAAYLAGGCFWCAEAVFENLKGVLSAAPGYCGGTVANPTYEEVSGGKTGHAETVKIEFNPYLISYFELLKIFFENHDPTEINRQGNDAGPQYRSIIFYVGENQKEAAENYVKELKERKVYAKPIATEIRPFQKFYEAEDYHKNYYEHHKDAPYCQLVIAPKLEKLQKEHGELLKK